VTKDGEPNLLDTDDWSGGERAQDAAACALGIAHRRMCGAGLSPQAGLVALDRLNAWLVTARAAEWLLDNGHRVRRALRRIAEDLPPRFYQRLPAVAQQADG
jgi:hypothetical protein